MAAKIPLITIDPDGDILFILRNPNGPFAIDRSLEPWPVGFPNDWSSSQQESEDALKGDNSSDDSSDDIPEIHMRLSSEHLALTSTYFKKLVANDWAETKEENGYSYTVTAEHWDKEALTILQARTECAP